MEQRFISREPWYHKYLRQGSVLICLIVLCLFFSILSPDFLNSRNLISVIRSCSVTIIIAMGMLVVIITGGIDLSLGCIVAVCGVFLAKMLVGGMSPFIAVPITLGIGMLMGLVNGVLIAYFDLQPFLVTLGTQVIYRGFALLYTTGRPVTNVPTSYCSIVGGKLFGWLPMPVVIMAITVLAFYWVIKYTKTGVYVYAIGGNAEAAKLSGIDVRKYKMRAYIMDGLLCALGAATMLGRLGAAEPTAASGYELDAIAAAAIGGTSLAGGKGSVIGTVLGALILQVLTNGMTLMNVQSYYQQIVTGIVIIVAVLIDRFTNKTAK